MATNSVAAGMTFDEKYEVGSEAYHTALDAIEEAYRDASRRGISQSAIAEKCAMSRSRVSRILNGEARNITLKTLFLIMHGMNRRVFIRSADVKELQDQRSNFHFSPDDGRFRHERPNTANYNVLQIKKAA